MGQIFGGQNRIGNRDLVVQTDAGYTGSGFIGNQFKVVSFTTNDATQSNQGVIFGFFCHRLQHYYQYQVVLKPAPSNILELYLGSLEALGFDLKQNDIRFVEDDWENPTLGAWGLGWEVWLNGMEVTQFTYFQEVGWGDAEVSD